MKKKIRFRLRNDLALPFWISIIICLLCAGINFFLFYNSFFRALSKFNEEPIATITFKYKTAQRKFLDRVVWDRLRQESPVYNGDTIHTAELSEATIWFEDGTTLELAESTMAQVFLHNDGSLGADLGEGSATVDSSESGNGLTLTNNNVQIKIQKGTKISAQTGKNSDINITVQKGFATSQDGTSFSEGKSFSVGTDGKTEARLSVQNPLPNEKKLFFEGKDYPLPFKWTKGANTKKLILKLSKDKGFSELLFEKDVSNMSEISVELPKGIYYWKLESPETKNNDESCSGKIQLIQALKPNLLTPAQGYTYQYRKKTPSVRFIWTESDTATAYNFEVSKNPDMSNPVIKQRSSSTSIIISTLATGKYYWKVTPYYVINRTGLANPSETGSFNIDQQGKLLPPVLATPANGDFVNKNQNKLTLSWEMDDEASSYKVVVASMKSLNFPTFTRETSDNYITFTGSDVSSLKNGEYYWAVSQLDGEGNESEKSEIRSFYAVDGKIEQRTVFPPDGYQLWKPLASDTRFTWKTNLAFTQHIQIASDKNFSNIVFDSEVAGTSFSGINLEEGNYWWRISSEEKDFKRSTEGKELVIVGEMDEPILTEPTATKKAIVRPSQNYVFKWERKQNEDYYRVRLYKGNSSSPILDENFISENRLPLEMEDFEEGLYRWELQSYAYETESSSRRSSRLASSAFTLRKIRPVELISPTDKTKIGGWEAIENPPVLKWKSSEQYSKAVLVLTKKNGLNAGVKKYIQSNYTQALDSLSSGTYEWTVQAFTLDDIDISALKSNFFEIEEIPPFDAPKDAKTEGGDIFNAAYLKKTPYIVFSWKSVSRADDYILEIKNSKKKVIKTQILRGNESTRYKLEDMASLSKGKFTWQVKAVKLSKDGKEILIDGKNAENKFTIDYSINLSGGKRKNMGELYGK